MGWDHYAQVCAIVSGLADVAMAAIILWRAHGRLVDVPTPVYCLFYFALADLVKLSALVLVHLHGTACIVQGSIFWYGLWASTLWMMAFAHTVWAHSVLLSRTWPRWRTHALYHALCWIPPVCGVSILAALHLFGDRETQLDTPYCTTKSSDVGAYAQAPKPIALLFHASCLLHAQHRIARVRRASAGFIEEAAAEQARQDTSRLRVDFYLYIAVFFLTQTPGVLVDLLDGANVSLHIWLSRTMDVLSFSHGLMNACVYGLTLRWIRHQVPRPDDQNSDGVQGMLKYRHTAPDTESSRGGRSSAKSDGERHTAPV